MQALQIITAYRDGQAKNLDEAFSYSPFLENGELIDRNAAIRLSLTEELLSDFSEKDLPLIRELFKAELLCAQNTRKHDSLYQLSYYLFQLAQLEDVFLLYEAKYLTGNMDVSSAQDRYSITVNNTPEQVLNYVTKCFNEQPELKAKYTGLTERLQEIIDYPEYNNASEYVHQLQYYFGVVPNETPVNLPSIKRPWWKFW